MPQRPSRAARTILVLSSAALLTLGALRLRAGVFSPKFDPLVQSVGGLGCVLAAFGLAVGLTSLAARRRANAALQAMDRRLLRARRVRLTVLFVMACAYVAIMGGFSSLRHHRFNSSTYDLAVYDQAVWNTSRGRWLETSIEARPGEYLNLLGDHFAPILTLFAPLYWLWPSVHLLLLLQTLALASGGLCTYAIAFRRTGSAVWALTFAAAYWLYPAVGFVNRFDFHPSALAIPLFLGSLLAIDSRRWGWAAAGLAGAMLCKEDMGLAVAALGVVLAVRGRRAGGLSLAAVGLGVSLAAMFVVLPWFRGEASDTWERYQHWGDSPMQAAKAILADPGGVALDVFGNAPRKIAFVVKLLLPLAALPLLCPLALLPALPALGYNLVSGNPSQASIYFQYATPIVPFVFYAGIMAVERLRQRRAAAADLLLLAVLAATVVAVVQDCPLTKPVAFPYWEVGGAARACDTDSARAVAARVPAQASLAATMALGPHFAHRRNLRLIWPLKSSAVPDTDYLIADLSDMRWNSAPSPVPAQQSLAVLLSQAVAKGYGIEYRAGPVLLLKRGAASADTLLRLMSLLDQYMGEAIRELRQTKPAPAF